MDPALVEVFVGENPKDMHSITGVKIFNSQHGQHFSYETFREVLFDKDSDFNGNVKSARALGKAVNFSSQYRVAAKKLSMMLFVTEAEAQVMLDAKEDRNCAYYAWSCSTSARSLEL